MGKSKFPNAGRKSPTHVNVPCDSALASLQLFASDGGKEPIVPRQVHESFPISPSSSIKIALPPGMLWVSVRATARNARARVRIYRWDPSMSNEGRKERDACERLHMTLCEKPLGHSRTEQQAAVVIQTISRGLAVRKAPDTELAPAVNPPPETVTMTAAEWTEKHGAELLQRVRHAAELRWKAVDGLHHQQQAQREEEARVSLAALKKRKEKAAAKEAKRVKGKTGGKGGVGDETAPLPELKAVLLPSDDQFAMLRPLAVLPPLLLNFLRANLLTICMHLRGARGGAGGAADGTGEGGAAAAVSADGTVPVEAFKACLRDLGFKSALHDPTDDLDAMIISLCRALGGVRHLPMASLHQYLLAASPELYRTDLQRISMYEPALFSEQIPYPSKGGAKGAAKGGASGPSKGGAAAAGALDAAAANAAKEQLALKQAHPEKGLLVRVVVIAEDLSTTTYTLEVRVAPPLCIPPLPDSLRPLMAHIVRYHGVAVQMKRTFGAVPVKSAVPVKPLEPKEAPSRASISRRAPNALSQSRTYGQQARTLMHKASDQDERAHRAAVASGTALNGELALSCERFVACCVTLRIAVGEVARLAFAQVSRERPDALLGASGVWCAFFFSFVRSLSADPLDVSRPLHRWFFDMDAVLALAVVKLEPLQYNLRAAATVNAGLLHGESALLTQLGSALSTGHAGHALAGATHYLVSGRLLARGDDALLDEVHSAESRSESIVGHAELLGTALIRTQASSTLGWSRLFHKEVFGRSIVRIRAITEVWSKSGRTNKADQLVPKIEWRAFARKWRSEVDASAHMDGGFAASETDERQILRQGKYVFMQAAMEEQQWPSASAAVMQRPTSSREVGNLRSHLGSTHEVGTSMEDGATQSASAALVDWGRNMSVVMSAPRVAAQLPATPADSSTERLARSVPMHSMIARNSAAVSGAHSTSPPSGPRDVDQLIEATRRFRIQSSLDQPRARLVPVDDAQAPQRYSQERFIKEQAAGLICNTAPRRAQHITHGASSSVPSSPHDRPRSAYTTTPQSPPYRMRYLEHVRADPHELDPRSYLLGSTFEYKQLYEEHAELADMKLEPGPEVRDIEPHLYDGSLLDGRLLLRSKATASSAPELDGAHDGAPISVADLDGAPTRIANGAHDGAPISAADLDGAPTRIANATAYSRHQHSPLPLATAYEPFELDTQHLHEPMSPELAAAADEAVERVHETVPKALETGPAPRPGSHYDRRTWRPVVAVATAAAALPCVPTIGHELEGEYVRHYLYHAASIWTAERSKASLRWRPPPRRPAPHPPQPLPGRLRVSPSSPSIDAVSSEAGLGTVQELGPAHSHPVARAAVIPSASTAMKAFQEQRRTFIRPWYVIAGKLNAPVVTKVERPFDLTKTIWAPRKEWSDAKDFVDHEDILFQRFSADWRRALPLGLVNMIMCRDDDDDVHQDGDGVPDEVDEVGAVLLMNHEWCTMAFNFFCLATRLGDDNLDEMGLEGWTQFAEDANLVNRQSEHCDPKHVGMIFREISAMGRLMARRAQEEAQQQAEAQRRRGHSGVVAPRSSPRAGVQTVEDINHGHSVHNARQALSRVQFMVGLVRLAIAKYIMPGDCDDLSEAVQLLFQSCIRPALRHVLVPPDEFRREVAYTPELSAVLCKHESSLRLIFAQLCLLSAHKLLCGLHTWRRFLAAAGLSGTDLSLADGTLCFLWSIICVVDGQTRGGRLKETCLPFEGWVEALCRVAMLKATPTDAEIADAGMLDGGQYMTLITADPRHSDKLNSLLRERSGVFGKLPQGQPLDRCVEHVLTMVIRRIQNSRPSIPRDGIVEQTKKGPCTVAYASSPPGAMGMADVQLSADEVNSWALRTGLVERT